MTTSVWGERADPAAGGAAARFTGVLGSVLLGRWAGLHPMALGPGALLPQGGHDTMVGAVGSLGRRAQDGAGWHQAAAGQGGREPLQAALCRARSWKRRLPPPFGCSGAVHRGLGWMWPQAPACQPSPKISIYNRETAVSFLCTSHSPPAGREAACSDRGWPSKAAKGNPVAFLQRQLIKWCLVSSAQGESRALAEPRAKLLLPVLG